MTWQPDPVHNAGRQPALAPHMPDDWGQHEARRAEQARDRRGWRWTAMVTLLVIGLGGLAAAAVGVAYQVLPRQFTTAQQRQIMTWEMTSRWRAYPAGRIFPAAIGYGLSAVTVASAKGVELQARRLGIGRQASCRSEVSAAAARILESHQCTVLLRATYLDSSGSMVTTLAVAVLPDNAAASEVARALTSTPHGLTFAVRALAIRGTPAARFRDGQRQLGWAVNAGPYVIMSTAGFTDGRPHEPLRTDSYYDKEMTSLISGLAEAISKRVGTQPPVPVCPGAPGC